MREWSLAPQQKSPEDVEQRIGYHDEEEIAEHSCLGLTKWFVFKLEEIRIQQILCGILSTWHSGIKHSKVARQTQQWQWRAQSSQERSVVSLIEACLAVLLLHTFQAWKELAVKASSIEREQVLIDQLHQAHEFLGTQAEQLQERTRQTTALFLQARSGVTLRLAFRLWREDAIVAALSEVWQYNATRVQSSADRLCSHVREKTVQVMARTVSGGYHMCAQRVLSRWCDLVVQGKYEQKLSESQARVQQCRQQLLSSLFCISNRAAVSENSAMVRLTVSLWRVLTTAAASRQNRLQRMDNSGQNVQAAGNPTVHAFCHMDECFRCWREKMLLAQRQRLRAEVCMLREQAKERSARIESLRRVQQFTLKRLPKDILEVMQDIFVLWRAGADCEKYVSCVEAAKLQSCEEAKHRASRIEDSVQALHRRITEHYAVREVFELWRTATIHVAKAFYCQEVSRLEAVLVKHTSERHMTEGTVSKLVMFSSRAHENIFIHVLIQSWSKVCRCGIQVRQSQSLLCLLHVHLKLLHAILKHWQLLVEDVHLVEHDRRWQGRAKEKLDQISFKMLATGEETILLHLTMSHWTQQMLTVHRHHRISELRHNSSQRDRAHDVFLAWKRSFRLNLDLTPALCQGQADRLRLQVRDRNLRIAAHCSGGVRLAIAQGTVAAWRRWTWNCKARDMETAHRSREARAIEQWVAATLRGVLLNALHGWRCGLLVGSAVREIQACQRHETKCRTAIENVTMSLEPKFLHCVLAIWRSLASWGIDVLCRQRCLLRACHHSAALLARCSRYQKLSQCFVTWQFGLLVGMMTREIETHQMHAEQQRLAMDLKYTCKMSAEQSRYELSLQRCCVRRDRAVEKTMASLSSVMRVIVIAAWKQLVQKEREVFRCRHLLHRSCQSGAAILARKSKQDQVQTCFTVFVAWHDVVSDAQAFEFKYGLNRCSIILQVVAARLSAVSRSSSAALLVCLIFSRWFRWSQDYSQYVLLHKCESSNSLVQRALFGAWRSALSRRRQDHLATQLQAEVDRLSRELAVSSSGRERRKNHALAIVEGSMNAAFLASALHSASLPPEPAG
jgi:hypothetical protein